MNIPDLHRLYLEHPVIDTDSRSIKPGSLFFAIKGEQFDGNLFAGEALAKGASYAIVDNPKVAVSEQFIVVPDTLATLQDLARFHRATVKIPVIGITGTNGKTTTKELIASVLGKGFRTVYTQGNLNNHLGVPLTLLRINTDHEMAVIEMGANHVGEIDFLCQIARPTHGIITNIGKAHLEGFGGIDGVIRAKTELYNFIRQSGGLVFVDSNNPLLTEKSKGMALKTYGRDHDKEILGEVIVSQPFLVLRWVAENSDYQVNTNLSGDYNLENVLAAICIGMYFNIPPPLINQALESYVPSNHRSQVMNTTLNFVILDAYNANPTSMQAAISHFQTIDSAGKCCILGDMFELGQYAREEHYNLCEMLQNYPFTKIILIGDQFYEFRNNFDFIFFRTTQDAAGWLMNNPLSGLHILLKGSRKMQLEKLLTYL